MRIPADCTHETFELHLNQLADHKQFFGLAWFAPLGLQQEGGTGILPSVFPLHAFQGFVSFVVYP